MRDRNLVSEGYRLDTAHGRAYANDVDGVESPTGGALGVAAGAVSGAIVGALITLLVQWLV